MRVFDGGDGGVCGGVSWRSVGGGSRVLDGGWESESRDGVIGVVV